MSSFNLRQIKKALELSNIKTDPDTYDVEMSSEFFFGQLQGLLKPKACKKVRKRK